ncbi:small integral membrane protein 12-A [Anopheles ziemanni]|uniref:small integral membrane protein 12-A n=1 Tax=Anopheles coustani TaxID=139045 RepID=UPI002658877F|nr:small integral membrane protein 12-A [Anopheles coustani]XP_058120671.1 small integral membrane protein 12-A [Anopheles coustani]XP_058120673.1 small integral membrane protein 12-A [Anopheles coustani]XP_058167036.1 small integral membrane protein 12-A [Anopheles ziemanni]
MWPLIMQFFRSNAAYITLPVATIVGVIGYNIESLLSDKYTPYSGSIQEKRAERITDESKLKDATNVEKLVYKENVLGRNLSPSLEK